MKLLPGIGLIIQSYVLSSDGSALKNFRFQVAFTCLYRKYVQEVKCVLSIVCKGKVRHVSSGLSQPIVKGMVLST